MEKEKGKGNAGSAPHLGCFYNSAKLTFYNTVIYNRERSNVRRSENTRELARLTVNNVFVG